MQDSEKRFSVVYIKITNLNQARRRLIGENRQIYFFAFKTITFSARSLPGKEKATLRATERSAFNRAMWICAVWWMLRPFIGGATCVNYRGAGLQFTPFTIHHKDEGYLKALPDSIKKARRDFPRRAEVVDATFYIRRCTEHPNWRLTHSNLHAR